MATIQNSIQLQDGASSVLTRINHSINMTSESFRKFQVAADNFMGLPGISASVTDIHSMGIQFEQVTEVIVQAKEQQEELNKSIDEGNDKFQKMKKLCDKALSGLCKMGINTSPMEIFNQANDIKAAGNLIQSRTGMQGQDLEAAKQSTKNLYVDNISGSPEDAAKSLSSIH